MEMKRVKNKKDAREFAEGVINDPVLEVQWAETAFKHAETYFKLLQIVPDVATMRLTRYDDAIYTAFRELFPDLNVALLDEDVIKSKESKEAWRPFLMQWEGKVEDFNFGTLLRLDAEKEYGPENSCIVPRVQFYCVELARNREGCQYKPS
eukprot:CAMPEP_0114618630 /NCGR_PEP_ID=MMETSP0168-20121206/7798_1 /TAXON_ID=95228 ORGANISM="Vannella sp., Strain DIVA3 517/6/12" /NCGR_SAMPLE_ID=MMETSP0168 /ASSEMBLY_ACC=CAM_ASM_000044 /LENGTH=150 /DNA_ID=CAMNT_0001829775 /DNA_START=18 /DNA_END=470 /DNA_ORIENTATION=-